MSQGTVTPIIDTPLSSPVPDYYSFLEEKTQAGAGSGFDPLWMPDFLFDFQRLLLEWAIRQGKAAIFADCGLGKTIQQLVWAENVHRKTGKAVLVVAPLSVAPQTQGEAQKFGIDAAISRNGFAGDPITITNYEQLHHFSPDDFGGMVCDESSIIKSFNGATRRQVTNFMRLLPYRLLCTATAAPNDYVELGTSSAALGHLTHFEMLERFFVVENNAINSPKFAGGRRVYVQEKYRLKGHAERPFWRWVSSWARAVRKPSDLGYADEGFVLPPLHERETIVEAKRPPAGRLFDVDAFGLSQLREEGRRTLTERCEAAARLAGEHDISIVWCHLNDEGDALERLVPHAVQVKGSDALEWKEGAAEWFKGERCICDTPLFRRKVSQWRADNSTSGCVCGYESGVRRLVSKPSIFGWGLNLQCCHHVVYFPSYSYESYYQAIRRCWRFGQTKPVTVDVVRTKAQQPMIDSLHRKSQDADRMFTELVVHMNDAMEIERKKITRFTAEVPAWLTT